jgi:hypothetical protein
MTLKIDTHTDIGNAERFVEAHGCHVRYCASDGRWLIWSGNSWQWDTTEMVVYFAQNTVKEMLAEALEVKDEDKRKASILHAMRSSNMAKIEAMLHLNIRPGQDAALPTGSRRSDYAEFAGQVRPDRAVSSVA